MTAGWVGRMLPQLYPRFAQPFQRAAQVVDVEEAGCHLGKEGAPVIHLGAGDNYLDLEGLLFNSPSPRRFKAIAEWLRVT